jgi:hypothetical protein
MRWKSSERRPKQPVRCSSPGFRRAEVPQRPRQTTVTREVAPAEAGPGGGTDARTDGVT